MSATAQFLREVGIELTEDEFVDALRASAIDRNAASRAPLSASATDYLTVKGGILHFAGGTGAASARAVSAWAAVIGTSRNVAQVASMLGIDPSRVRHRITDGALYAITAGHGRLLPAWQFESGHVIPGVRQVLAALPDDMHPLEVAGWMTTPAPDLEVAGTPLSPRAWLAAGGVVQAVIDLAADIDLF